MNSKTKKYATLTVKQLKQLIEDSDDDKEIRVWVEFERDGIIVLEGRRLIGVNEGHFDEYLCLVAGYEE